MFARASVGKLFRTQMEVEYGSVGIDDEFGFWDYFLIHGFVRGRECFLLCYVVIKYKTIGKAFWLSSLMMSYSGRLEQVL